jgi:hypothetical protein
VRELVDLAVDLDRAVTADVDDAGLAVVEELLRADLGEPFERERLVDGGAMPASTTRS